MSQNLDIWDVFWKNEACTDKTKHSRKVVSRRRVAGAIRFLVNARSTA